MVAVYKIFRGKYKWKKVVFPFFFFFFRLGVRLISKILSDPGQILLALCSSGQNA